ncbi:MAG: Na+/H+ antiporter NhaA [Campylobacterales bacterium]|nr:Na+/H+ antiporter NhaA [Campylobacterales bacterium]
MVIQAFSNFVSKEAFSGILLFVAAVCAVLVANSGLGQQYFDFWHMHLGMALGSHVLSMTLEHWVNDALMALFFLMVGLEIKREMLIGELASVQKAAFPVLAAIGGMVVPALIYVMLNPSNPMGFGVPMATDIAFALGILMLLGKRANVSAKLFLVALAVVDDLGAVLIVATVYTGDIQAQYFLPAALIYALIWILNLRGCKSLLPYLILGIALWFYIHAIGIHATIAGVLLAMAIPVGSKIDEQTFLNNSRGALDNFEHHIDEIPVLNHHQIDALEQIAYGYDKVQNPLVRLEHNLHGLSAFFIMPLFAFVNAGVLIDMSSLSEHFMVASGVALGLLIGKPVGIVGLTWLGARLGIVKKPDNLSWPEIVGVGFLGGIGFTMSIFITNLAFADPQLINAVKLAIFSSSLLAGILGALLIVKASRSTR